MTWIISLASFSFFLFKFTTTNAGAVNLAAGAPGVFPHLSGTQYLQLLTF